MFTGRMKTRNVSVFTSVRHLQESLGLREASTQCHLTGSYNEQFGLRIHRQKGFPSWIMWEENFLSVIQKLNLHIVYGYDKLTVADYVTVTRHRKSKGTLQFTRDFDSLVTVINEFFFYKNIFNFQNRVIINQNAKENVIKLHNERPNKDEIHTELYFNFIFLCFFLREQFMLYDLFNSLKDNIFSLFTVYLIIIFNIRYNARKKTVKNTPMKSRKDIRCQRDTRRLSKPKYLQTSLTFQPKCSKTATNQLGSLIISAALHPQPSSTSELPVDLKWLLHPRPRPNQTVRLYPVTFLPPTGSSSLPKEAMSYKGSRLASLASLPASCDVSRVRLAEAGFYYDPDSQAQRNDSNRHELVCYSCGLAYGGWLPGDHPTQVHQRLKPDCPHLLRSQQRPAVAESACLVGPLALPSLQSGSDRSAQAASPAPQASLGPLSLSSSSLSAWGSTAWVTEGDNRAAVQTDLATDCLAIVPDLAPSSSRQGTEPLTRYGSAPPLSSRDSLSPASSADPTATSRSRELREDLEDRPLLAMGSAVYPQYCLQQERLATFRLWPLTHVFRPDDLVRQGFYYAGYADCIRCFYCGVGLKSWIETDDVMKEHIRWRPSCGYILNTRGRRFVENVFEMLRLETGTQTSVAAVTSSDPAHTPQSTSADPSLARTQLDNPTSRASPGSPQHRPSTAVLSAHGGQSPLRLGETQRPRYDATPDQARSDVVHVVEGMGFSRDVMDRAVRHLQQLGLSIERPEEIIETILSMGLSDSGAVSTTTDDSGHLNSVQTDAESWTPQETSSGQSELVQQTMQENERLRSLQTCKICRAAKVGMIFMPCGHVTTCMQCGTKIKHCNLCGHFIRATANIYLS